MIFYYKDFKFLSGINSNSLWAKTTSSSGHSYDVYIPFFALTVDLHGRRAKHDMRFIGLGFFRAAMKYPDGFMIDRNRGGFEWEISKLDVSEIWPPTENEIRMHKIKYLAMDEREQ